MNGERQSRLIAYDIRDPRRLGQVFRFLKGAAIPIQYSVFLQIEASRREMADVEERLIQLLDANEDDVRIYPLPTGCEAIRIGLPFMGEGLILKEEWMHEFLSAAGLAASLQS